IVDCRKKAEVVQGLDDSLAPIELQCISGEPQFDRVIAEAQELDVNVINGIQSKLH
ncbi:hypothetical protein HAX54_042082, partial [Datura stramonium]|nr:hypothetical protein [Datura stramonium]